ncbi:MAG: hypothetical protein HY290_07095 [Planctomycetia bacterium]|nr:hypothetical protein [Planctomycetia bacterium]
MTAAALVAPAAAAEPVVLKHKFAKGDQLVYRKAETEKQHQKIFDMKLDTTTTREVVNSLVVDEVDSAGSALLKSKAVRRLMKSEGPTGKFEFDSKSTERDTSSETGAAVTPVLERLTGSEYQLKVTASGAVVEVRGFAEMIADLVKASPFGVLQAGFMSDNEGAAYSEQEQFVVLSDKAVAPGDTWEVPFDVELKGLGKIKGTLKYTYEADDKVGDRKTVRIGEVMDYSLEMKLDAPGARVSGTVSSTNSTGTVQFDPVAGRVVSSKRTSTASGQLTVEAGGMTFMLDDEEEHTATVELLDKLPE